MPFADADRVIAVPLQELRNGEPGRLNERRVEPVQHAVFQSRPPTVSAGQDSVSSRRANGRRRMSIGESHSARRKIIDVWRRNLRLGVVARDVAVSEIIGENVNDVWMIRSKSGGLQDE